MDEKKVILIVEDEKALLDSYVEILQNGGYTVVSAGDGYKGLESMKANQGNIDLVLLDLMMPGIDGLEVLRTVKDDKGAHGDMPIVVLSNMTSEKVIKEAFDLGAASYLIKTELEYEDLLVEVGKILGK